jgi:hypothetical protein
MKPRQRGILFFALSLVLQAGCGGQAATVHGRVTCDGNGVEGSILFSPIGEGEVAQGPLDADGNYRVTAKAAGKYKVTVNPKDRKRASARPGEIGKELPYACDLTAEKEITSGDNLIDIALGPPKK